MKSIIASCAQSPLGRLYALGTWLAATLAPVFDLAVRLYVARVFILSGLTKLHDWHITLALFADEYKVPVLPPAVAAVMSTTAELGLSSLLIIGLAGRFSAAGLFVVNAVALISYHASLDAAGVKDHILWGTLLLFLVTHGMGLLSMDGWLKTRLGR
ncbi:DoxX family protein [Silvimonas sp.]|uniref:DoxX family protein n=1 Tax=Silvimonas sp. TaxID=2650811 RepID=UPI0028491A8B|nr:DoxX family protein [Silvimonas sp.]MDR3426508.1 DoxX family protein [Silvimonas sp.]